MDMSPGSYYTQSSLDLKVGVPKGANKQLLRISFFQQGRQYDDHETGSFLSGHL